jgi:dTDP-4-dehydrorhamnose reductase
MQVFEYAGEVQGYDLPEVDIADAAQVNSLVSAFAPQWIINAAAYTDVEAAEDNPEPAYRVNETGARVVAEAAARADADVVYYSTDYVFGGVSRKPYEPDAPLAPLGVYAQSKAAGEAAVQAAASRFYILRTAWLYGPGGNNFVEKILRAAATRPALKVVNDETGSPTHTRDLAEATQAILRSEHHGVYHAVNAGACSRFEFAREIVGLAELDVEVNPCSCAEFPMKAPRPAYSVLSTRTLELTSGYRMQGWREALADYMERRKDVS